MKSTKSRRALLIKIDYSADTFRLVLDDVINLGSATWQVVDHYTSDTIEKSKLLELNHSEKELADFGYAILARLRAHFVIESEKEA